jgi:uncharacterized membrane protein YdjX (TVP38/TMEM64 family)
MAPTREPLRLTDWLRIAIPIAVAATFVVVAWHLGYFHLENPQALDAAAERVEGTPWLGPIFVAAYATVAALAAPVSPLAYGAGAIFGVVRGTSFVWLGSMLGGVAGYWLARGVWAEPARRLVGRGNVKLDELRKGNVFLTTARFQLLPIVPFGLFNYAAGATRISFTQYLGGTALGIIPGSVAAVYVGDRIAAGFRGSGKGAFLVGAGVALALLLASFVPMAIMRLRRRQVEAVSPTDHVQ